MTFPKDSFEQKSFEEKAVDAIVEATSWQLSIDPKLAEAIKNNIVAALKAEYERGTAEASQARFPSWEMVQSEWSRWSDYPPCSVTYEWLKSQMSLPETPDSSETKPLEALSENDLQALFEEKSRVYGMPGHQYPAFRTGVRVAEARLLKGEK